MNAGALLEQAIGAAKRDRLVAAKKTDPRDVGEDAGADAGFAVGIALGASGNGAGAVVLGLPGLRLKADAGGQGPAACFDCLQQDCLLGRAPVGVFDGHIYFVEESKVIEIALRIGERSAVERIAGVESDGASHRLRASEHEAGQQNIADNELLTFVNVKDDVDLAGI